jgi:hypothetical protein
MVLARGDAAGHERAPHSPGDDEQHPADRRRDAQAGDRPPPVAGRGDRARRGEQGEHAQRHREYPHPIGETHGGGAQRAEVVAEQRDPVLSPQPARQRRFEDVEGGGGDRSHVGDREGDGVLVALEDRTVQVADPGPEQAPEGPAADRRGDDRLDQRPRGEQVVGVAQDEIVGHLPGDERPDRGRLQRGGGAVGELT